MPIHTVSQGECISSIADKTGFFWETIWNHPDNSQLKQLRQNPNALQPGDSLFVPDKRKKEEPCSPTQRHTFRIHGVPARFNLRVLDATGAPRAGIPYTLVIDGKTTTGTIPNHGNLSEIIQPDAKKAKLVLSAPGFEPEQYQFQLGYMNPSGDAAGVQARLKNLGYYQGPIDGVLNEVTLEALGRFQQDSGLVSNSQIDEQTELALAQRHGG